jgi:4-amino-4-deoxy-L-arabinose transferase-like glycosyltransferase
MIWLILLLSLGLRLIGINQSMWLDESISANIAKLSIEKIVPQFSVGDFHPPLFYLVLDLWVKVVGSGVIQMRILSVIFSLITIWLVYKIGSLLKDKKTGLWAAILVGVNPLLIYYSQELRMYSMMTMFLMGAVYFWIKIVKNKETKKSWWFGFNLMVFLAFLTFYGSVFLSAALILYLIWQKKLKGFFGSVWGLLLAIAVVSPLLLTQLKMSGQMLNEVTNWSLVLGKVNLKNLILIPLKFSIGRISWYPKTWYYLIGGGWSLIVFGLALKQMVKNKKLLWLLVTPIILGVLFSFKSPLMQYFRFIYLVPILALALAEIKSKWLKLGLVLGFLGFSGFYLLNSNMHREDWKSVAASLGNGTKVYMIESFSDPIKFYNSTVFIKDIKTVLPTEEKIVLIPYGEAIHGVDSRKKMEELGYKMIKENSFREITTEEWQKQK